MPQMNYSTNIKLMTVVSLLEIAGMQNAEEDVDLVG